MLQFTCKFTSNKVINVSYRHTRSALGEEEKKQWLAAQSVKRSYADEVLSQLDGMPDYFSVIQYIHVLQTVFG